MQSFIVVASLVSELTGGDQNDPPLKVHFLSWQKSLAYSLRIFVGNFFLLSTLQRVLAAWLKKFN